MTTPQPGTLVDVRARVDSWVDHPVNDPDRPIVWIDENEDVSAPVEHVQPHWPQEYRTALVALAEAVRKQRNGDNTFAADEDVRLLLARVLAAQAEVPQ